MEKVISYLVDLSQNNEREWFHANKVRYQESKISFLSVVEQIIRTLELTDIRIQGLATKDTVFRINRDVRFSRDKSPYKTHFGSYIAKGGRKSPDAGYYLHIEPDQFFIGAGAWHPEKEELKAIRHEIMYQPENYSSVINSVVKKGFTIMEEDKLKTGPKDFDKDSPHIDLIKYKSYILSRKLSNKEIKSPDIAAIVANYFEQLYPYTSFLNTAMDYMGNE